VRGPRGAGAGREGWAEGVACERGMKRHVTCSRGALASANGYVLIDITHMVESRPKVEVGPLMHDLTQEGLRVGRQESSRAHSKGLRGQILGCCGAVFLRFPRSPGPGFSSFVFVRTCRGREAGSRAPSVAEAGGTVPHAQQSLCAVFFASAGRGKTACPFLARPWSGEAPAVWARSILPPAEGGCVGRDGRLDQRLAPLQTGGRRVRDVFMGCPAGSTNTTFTGITPCYKTKHPSADSDGVWTTSCNSTA